MSSGLQGARELSGALFKGTDPIQEGSDLKT